MNNFHPALRCEGFFQKYETKHGSAENHASVIRFDLDFSKFLDSLVI